MATMVGTPQSTTPSVESQEAMQKRRYIQRVRAKNTRILGRLVQGIVERYQGEVSPAAMPYQVFQCLQQELGQCVAKLDLTVYPARQRCYAKYIVYNHKDNGDLPFCFTLIVLGPGQKTPKHSHRVDCAPICVQGRIEETLYREEAPEPGNRLGKLEVLRKNLYEPFQGGYLLQDQPNVHHLENPSPATSMSLHLYVFDAEPDARGIIGSSILHIYP